MNKIQETDPTGRDAHTKGAKLDAGKVRCSLVLGGFPRALLEVAKVGTYGANKYTDNGWMEVPNGIERYNDALMRHQLSELSGERCDRDTGLLHAAHAAWNALARLELQLRRIETQRIHPMEAAAAEVAAKPIVLSSAVPPGRVVTNPSSLHHHALDTAGLLFTDAIGRAEVRPGDHMEYDPRVGFPIGAGVLVR